MTTAAMQAPVSAPGIGDAGILTQPFLEARESRTGRTPNRSAPALDDDLLAGENHRFRGTGARSEENRALGFAPAFRDADTGVVYRSRFRDGTPAPFHLLDGLPAELAATREASGRVVSLKASVVSGFVLEGRFFTRGEAAAWLAEWSRQA